LNIGSSRYSSLSSI